jgi:hypothetical protein
LHGRSSQVKGEPPSSPVVIVQADDVILTEIVTVLDLNEHERNIAGTPDPVSCADRDIDW